MKTQFIDIAYSITDSEFTPIGEYSYDTYDEAEWELPAISERENIPTECLHIVKIKREEVLC